MAITWSEPSSTVAQYGARLAKAVCTTGTEAGPAQNDVTSGLDLRGLSGGGVGLHVESTPDAAFTAGTVEIYMLNAVTGNWNLVPDLQVAVPAGVHRVASAGFAISAGVGRIAAVPNGLGQSCEIHLNGTGGR
jgi:hypothetical protein